MSSESTSTIASTLLGQALLGRGHIAPADLDRALALKAQNPTDRLGAILVRLGALSEENLLAALTAQTGYPAVTLADIPRSGVDAALRRLDWPGARLQALRVCIWEDDEGIFSACAEDPLDASLQEAVEAEAGRSVQWHFIRNRDLERLLAGLSDGMDAQPIDAARYREMAEDGPVIAFVNNLIAQAIDERASDIHIEPGEFACETRYRIDGVLHTRSDFGLDRFPAVASRIKLIAGLDIAERRLPQDGRITLRAAGAEMDMRVSVVPAVHGESIVMRLLPKQRHDLRLEALGMEGDQLAQLRRWLDLPSGLVLVTGPTGSGKSTTLYAALSAVDDRTRKILTVEDPVEHRLPGIMQVQVQAEIGYTFARALRSFLRHDPDIIMVGEIRDRETAEIAIQSALTGHLVLATLHTNDALSAFTRLTDMGIEPYLVAAAVQAVMAQRLVRRLCARCAAPTEAPINAATELSRWPPASPPAWRVNVGCEQCQRTGYRGRLGIYELVDVSAELRHAVATMAAQGELERIAVCGGRRSLRQDGMLKARRGETTMAEVARVAGSSAASPG
ncbi:MAG TPA: ATPase, T2SS/T4P/T4SS family [Burkholderiaceae bacterium]|nr:ATPase, T2SS/T4P/T4SS family [Burkholderiaceae bacterium]